MRPGRDTARDLGASLSDLALERTGRVASGAGHLALILFLLFGGAFTRTPLPPMEVAEVTVISEEEFALLLRPETAPEAGEGVSAPESPESTVAPLPPRPRPELAETEPAPAPAPSAPAAPELTAPPPVAAAPDPPAPAPAPRIAPETAPETPETEEAPVVVEETAPGPDAPEEVVEEQRPAAPAEAAPEIVTEAERPSGAPAATPRPRARPDRVARLDPGRSFEAASEPEPEPEPEVAPESEAEAPDREALTAAITEALSEAVSNARAAAPEQGAASGPPLSQGEQDAFRVAVERCWIVDPGSPAASVTVVVAVRMTRDAKPDTASINLLGAQGGDDSAQRTAFEAARRAILRCGAEGFPLPPEKYERWAQVEMTFKPEGMRIR